MPNDDDAHARADTPNEVFRRRLREVREARGVSQYDLVRELRALGYPMRQPAITRIERGQRKVSLDEAVAIAAALNVLPERLYRTPLDWDDYMVAQAEMGPGEELTPDEAWLRVWAHQRRREQSIQEEDQ